MSRIWETLNSWWFGRYPDIFPGKQFCLDTTAWFHRLQSCIVTVLNLRHANFGAFYPGTWQVDEATFLSNIHTSDPRIPLWQSARVTAQTSPWGFLGFVHCTAAGTGKQLSPGLAWPELHHFILPSDLAHNFQPSPWLVKKFIQLLNFFK